jgi:hypothetical protein
VQEVSHVDELATWHFDRMAGKLVKGYLTPSGMKAKKK